MGTDLKNTIDTLWHARARFERVASALRHQGDSQAAEQLSLVANRYGNSLLDIESVAQQYEKAIAALPESVE
ncbi:hypothetical protein [Billgrantia gudaonensis]|uniref:Uncharacterized protein n=1 Tax=Billgrantia gudaonensis TaxID=376427 RepID=A0A1G9E2Y6_9GAMM|nr:hypothetical protein [Halomonas gudaonensis]SDK70505.1 hypothetical protein SAMN04487954_12411 [Halomonas gudaonensis]